MSRNTLTGSIDVITPAAAQLPAQATAAVATLAAVANMCWVVDRIFYSYSAAPTGGNLAINWGTPEENYAILLGGFGTLLLGHRRFPVNTAVVVTLASGAGTVVGKVYVSAYLEPL